MIRALLLTACLFTAACSASRSPNAGSQTHFLKACDDSCPAPYSCLCGVCSLTCESNDMCRPHADGARCTPAAASCGFAENMCEVTCDGDSDCRMLGASFQCDAGRCRPEQTISAGGAGAAAGGGGAGASGAGAGGVGGASGRGGQGGRGAIGGNGAIAEQCAEHERVIAEFLTMNTSCTRDWDCAIVGSCSSGWGFESVSASAKAEAQALSDATVCGTFDGPLFRAFCEAGSCRKEATGVQCGQVNTSGLVCDGSDAIRFGVSAGGGFVDPLYPFTHPHGYSYMLIDGTCRYYAVSQLDGRIRSGTLSEEDARLLANDVSFGILDQWDGMSNGDGADCGATTVLKVGAAVQCVCGCNEDAPHGMRSAVRGAMSWTQRLGTESPLLNGALRAMAQEIPGLPQSTPVLWPLDRPMTAITGLIEGGAASDSSGARFEGEDAATLRAIRDAAAGRVYVRDGTAGVYTLDFRDELPDVVETAFDTFKSAANN